MQIASCTPACVAICECDRLPQALLKTRTVHNTLFYLSFLLLFQLGTPPAKEVPSLPNSTDIQNYRDTDMTNHTSTQTGFTFFEVIVATLIIGIVSSFAAPALAKMMSDGQLEASAHALRNAIGQTRNEALNHGVPVSICAQAIGEDIACAGDETGSWNTGWVIFTDRHGTKGSIDEGDAVLAVIPGPRAPAMISTRHTHVTYQPNGRLADHRADFQLSRAACAEGEFKTLRVPRSGMPRIEDGVCGA